MLCLLHNRKIASRRSMLCEHPDGLHPIGLMLFLFSMVDEIRSETMLTRGPWAGPC